MHFSAKSPGLSPHLLIAIRAAEGGDGDPREDSGRQLRACEDEGVLIAQGVQKQLVACDMHRPLDWLRHRALVIGYVCGMAETAQPFAGGAARWASALICLNGLSALLGSEWNEDALSAETQRLREQEHPGYIAGARAAKRDRLLIQEGKTADTLTCSIIDREMQYG